MSLTLVLCLGNKKNEDGEEDAKDFSVKMNRDDPEAGQNLNDYTEKGGRWIGGVVFFSSSLFSTVLRIISQLND